MKRLVPIAIALLAAAYTPAKTLAAKGFIQDLPNFAQVAPGLFRGGQPSEHGLELLKQMGVKTIVSLRHNRTQVQLEQEKAQTLGINFKRVPLDGLHKVSAKTIREFLDIAQNPANQPVFVHCQYGQDRTGAMVAIYREEVQKWSAKKAYDEMVRLGFETRYAWLADSVFDYEEDKLGQMSAQRPAGVKVLDSVETAIGARPSYKTRIE